MEHHLIEQRLHYGNRPLSHTQAPPSAGLHGDYSPTITLLESSQGADSHTLPSSGLDEYCSTAVEARGSAAALTKGRMLLHPEERHIHQREFFLEYKAKVCRPERTLCLLKRDCEVDCEGCSPVANTFSSQVCREQLNNGASLPRN